MQEEAEGWRHEGELGEEREVHEGKLDGEREVHEGVLDGERVVGQERGLGLHEEGELHGVKGVQDAEEELNGKGELLHGRR